MASYTQESTRFVNYNKQMEASYIYPIIDDRFNKPFDASYNVWIEGISYADAYYKGLLKLGWKPQDARSVLPNALASKIIVTQNLRSWRHFFLMRSSVETHPQLRQITQELLTEFKRCIPILYDDIEPNSRQITNLSLGR